VNASATPDNIRQQLDDRTTKLRYAMKQHVIELKMSRIHRLSMKSVLHWCCSGYRNNVNDNRKFTAPVLQVAPFRHRAIAA